MARLLRLGLGTVLGLLVVLGFVAGLLYLRLSSGPLTFASLPQYVASRLAEQIGSGWSVALRESGLELYEGALALHATDLQIRNPEGALVLKTPHALVSVDSLALLTGHVQPRAMEFRDLQVRALVNPDGSLAFTPAAPEDGSVAEPRAALPAPVPATPAGSPPPSRVSKAVVSLFETFVGPAGLLGVLEEARLTNARLTLVDSDGKERVTFKRADATFQRESDGVRRFGSSLEGAAGTWKMEGSATPDGSGGYRTTVAVRDAPVQDILLLAGLSRLPATAEMNVSGQVEMLIAGGQVTQLSTRLQGGAGRIVIDDKDTTPQKVDSTAVDLAWDETRRTLLLRSLAFRGGATKLDLAGELNVPAGAPWSATLAGRNGVLEGVLGSDAPVALDRIEAQLSGRDGIVLDKLQLRGPTLAVDLTGAYGFGGDPGALRVQGQASKSAVRSVLRVWPQAVTPPVREFLVKNLKAGAVETLNLAVVMSSEDLKKATADGPTPDASVKVDFALRDAELAAAEGLPPLTQTQVTGHVTGTKASVVAPSGRVVMADGRALNASAGTFTIDNYWLDQAIAQIAFRMDGGADALGSFLQAPLMREIAGVELDPATMKGRTDLRVAIPLAVNNMPKFADLPFSVQGTISDLTIEKVFGKDRLEGANLAVSYDNGALGIKGEGRLAGNPAQIDVRQQRGQGGEAALSMTLDEAARARKGISFGAQLTGPVGVKAAVPLGRTDKPGTRVEVDLARATVNQAIPGWAKPAGRPGRLTFILPEGQTSELKDFVLESGPVQLRGSVVLSDDGQLDKADLPTFKLSPGDDMRALVERSGNNFKATLRGNVGDMRPFIRLINAPPPPPAPRASGRETKERDFEVDLALNILTGHNDETLTNATVKATVRNSLLRQLQLNGRLGSTNLKGDTVARGGQNYVVVQGEDAGAVLRFFDVYRRMVGGELYLQLGTGEGPQEGYLNLSRFSLRNEPALSRIIPTQSQTLTTTDENGRSRTVQIDVNQVNFNRAQVPFTRTAGRLEFRDAVISGNEVGFTLGGLLDLPKDRVDISGTFVPAYALNNAFAQLPLIGPILGGGRNEGLFGVTFRITGQASAPTLNVNPLSAIAPGFLRKIFGGVAGPVDPNAPLPAPSGGDR
ncbi:MAG TPA: DUF3971 domain-containing protein [Microvirga sp.]|jgi:hypothetical protein|nr:DUF3971 domain-containing protein [Microvirga sp.]